jgi:hypothetical protein
LGVLVVVVSIVLVYVYAVFSLFGSYSEVEFLVVFAGFFVVADLNVSVGCMFVVAAMYVFSVLIALNVVF